MNGFADHLQLFRRFVNGNEAIDGGEGARDEAFWTSFGAFIIRHQAAHFLLARIEDGHAPEPVPDSLVTALRSEVDRTRDRVEGLIALLPRIDRELVEAGVDYLVLKGPVCAARYFGDVHHRRQVDLDILVRRDELSGALAVLRGLGFEPKPRRTRRKGDRTTVIPHLLRTEHGMVLSRGELGVDLHWSLRTAPAYRFDEASIWADRQMVQVEEGAYPALSDEHALLLFLVSLGHDIGRGAGRLKHVLDIHQLIRATHGTIDWGAFLRRRVEDNTISVVVNVLDLHLRIIADRSREPELVEALREYEGLLVCRDDLEAMALLSRPKGDPRNHQWFLRIYPIRWWRDSIWWIDRNVPHPGRLLLASSKATRYAGRYVWSLLRPGSRSAL